MIPLDYHKNTETELRNFMQNTINELKQTNVELVAKVEHLNKLLLDANEALIGANQWKPKYERCKARLRALKAANEERPPTQDAPADGLQFAKQCWLVIYSGSHRLTLEDLHDWPDVEACVSAVISGKNISLIRSKSRMQYTQMHQIVSTLHQKGVISGRLLLEWYNVHHAKPNHLVRIELARFFRHVDHDNAHAIAKYAKTSPALLHEGAVGTHYKKRMLPMNVLVA